MQLRYTIVVFIIPGIKGS